MSAGEQGPMGTERLACGRSVDELIDQVASGRGDQRDAHQQDCVHCRAALNEYSRLWTPVQDLAAEKITAPEGRLDRMLRTLRGVMSEPDYATLPAGPDGTTRIAARVVVVTARRSAEEVPGVRVALSRTVDDHGNDDGGVSAGVAGTSTVVEIVLAASYGEDLHALSEQVRRTVRDRIHELTGLSATEVTVVIDDVLE